MEVKIVNRSRHPLPEYATALSAGMDLRANIDAPLVLRPLERKPVPTGLYMALPPGYEAQVRPRSGLALKKGITVLARDRRCGLPRRGKGHLGESFGRRLHHQRRRPHSPDGRGTARNRRMVCGRAARRYGARRRRLRSYGPVAVCLSLSRKKEIRRP